MLTSYEFLPKTFFSYLSLLEKEYDGPAVVYEKISGIHDGEISISLKELKDLFPSQRRLRETYKDSKAEYKELRFTMPLKSLDSIKFELRDFEVFLTVSEGSYTEFPVTEKEVPFSFASFVSDGRNYHVNFVHHVKHKKPKSVTEKFADLVGATYCLYLDEDEVTKVSRILGRKPDEDNIFILNKRDAQNVKKKLKDVRFVRKVIGKFDLGYGRSRTDEQSKQILSIISDYAKKFGHTVINARIENLNPEKIPADAKIYYFSLSSSGKENRDINGNWKYRGVPRNRLSASPTHLEFSINLLNPEILDNQAKILSNDFQIYPTDIDNKYFKDSEF